MRLTLSRAEKHWSNQFLQLFTCAKAPKVSVACVHIVGPQNLSSKLVADQTPIKLNFMISITT